MQLPTVADADVRGKRVLVRVDFNVPMQGAAITDDARIRAAVPTLELLLKGGAQKIILLTHLGRPDGSVVEAERTAPLLERLREYVDCAAIDMHENLRFDPREEANDPSLARELASLGDVYVNEAFSNSHRAHASMVGLPKLLPSFAGLELVSEVAHLSAALQPPQNALAIVGGAKFETKEPLLEKLLELYPRVLLCGVLAIDMLKARGMPVGSSLTSQAPVPTVMAGDERIIVPVDIEVESPAGERRAAGTGDVRADERIMDIGARTAAQWGELLRGSGLVLWNGPSGVFEKGYVEGTQALARAIVEGSGKAIIGGGDTAAALAQFTFDPERIFISTGGGAMLEFLANGGSLPALEALNA